MPRIEQGSKSIEQSNKPQQCEPNLDKLQQCEPNLDKPQQCESNLSKPNNDKINPETLLKSGQAVQISPIGYSMYPFLVPGKDQVVIVPATEENYRRGDVVLYRRKNANTAKHSASDRDSIPSNLNQIDNILVLHRIWKHKPDGYYMVGDNQVEIEGPIARDQIHGYLVKIIKKNREIPVENIKYRMLSNAWLCLRPFRPILSHIVAAIKRIFRQNKG